MPRAYKRDARGRFAGSGTFKPGSRAKDKGKDARSNASLMGTLKAGEKQSSIQHTRNAQSAARGRVSSTGAQAKSIGRSERVFKQKANQSKIKQRRMERERKTFAKIGARRGGGK